VLKTRTIFMTLLMAVVLMMASVVSAQDVDACFGLDADACAAIAEASANSAAATSFNQTFSIDFSVTGVPEGEDLMFAVAGEGPVVMNMEQMIPLNFDATMMVTLPGMGEAEVMARLVDGIMYVTFEGAESWMGLDLMEALASGDLPIDPTTLMGDPEAAMGALPTEDLEAFAPLLAVPGFLTYVNDGDVYTFTADLTALISAPEFGTALEAIGEAIGDPSIASLGMLAPMLLSEGTITVTQVVDPALNAVVDLSFDVSAVVDAGMLTGDTEAAPLDINLAFNVALSQVGEAFDIVVPDNVEMQDMGGM
jgi:hypothetical protein